MNLDQCYHGIVALAVSKDLDSLEVAQEVDRYRRRWKPEKVKLVLLAESHARTSQADFSHKWSYQRDPEEHGKFVRFVYCLANGEGSILDRPDSIPNNTGTWQFWKILFSCVNSVSKNEDFGAVLKRSTPEDDVRIGNKIQLLRRLKESGVWLVDGSIAGINGLNQTSKDEILKYCWRIHIGPLLENLEPKPHHILVVGKGVRNALGTEIRKRGFDFDWIPQPQDRSVRDYRQYYRKCYEMSLRAGAVLDSVSKLEVESRLSQLTKIGSQPNKSE